MVAFVALAAIAAALFFASYITKRRFGILGLALAAGSLLSANWAGTLTPFLEGHGIYVTAPPLGSLVQIGLILAPPVLLLFGGPAYDKRMARAVGSLVFAILALTFLADILNSILVLASPGSTMLQFLHNYQSDIITAGLVLAITDMLFTHKPNLRRHKKAEH